MVAWEFLYSGAGSFKITAGARGTRQWPAEAELFCPQGQGGLDGLEGTGRTGCMVPNNRRSVVAAGGYSGAGPMAGTGRIVSPAGVLGNGIGG